MVSSHNSISKLRQVRKVETSHIISRGFMGASLIVAQSLVVSESTTTTGTGACNTVPLSYRACTGECYVQPLGKHTYNNGDMSTFTPLRQPWVES